MITKGLLLSLTIMMVLFLALLPAAAQEKSKGAAEEKSKEAASEKKAEGLKETTGVPTGEGDIKVTRAAVGLGVTWGSGTLKFKGKEYKFKVSGLNLISVGFTSTDAKGEVYNLKDLSDFPGKYFGVEAGATLVKGSAGLVLKNTKGVLLNLKSERKGVDLRIGNEGLSISPEWE